MRQTIISIAHLNSGYFGGTIDPRCGVRKPRLSFLVTLFITDSRDILVPIGFHSFCLIHAGLENPAYPFCLPRITRQTCPRRYLSGNLSSTSVGGNPEPVPACPHAGLENPAYRFR